MNQRVLVPPDLSGSGRRYLLDRSYELIVNHTLDEMENALQCCDAALLHNESWPGQLLKRAGERLKAISTPGGYQQQIDLTTAEKLGIWVVNAAQASYLSRAEYEIALILSCSKQITRMDFLARSKNETAFQANNSMELSGKRIGFVGWDDIALLVAQKCRFAFDMQSSCFVREAGTMFPAVLDSCETIQELFAVSDFVCIHTEQTGKLGMELFNCMKQTAYLICIPPLQMLSCQDLYNALRMNMLAGAALNVRLRAFPGGEQLLQQPTVTPLFRSAYCTYESINRTDLFAAQSLNAILNGYAVPELCTNPDNPRIYLQS